MPTQTSPDTGRDLRPLYAAAGLTDLIAETLRSGLERGQDEAAQRWNDLVHKTPRLPLALSPSTRERLTELQVRAGRAMAGAESTYNQLAGRGKDAVDGAVGSARAFGQQAGQRLVAGMPAPFDRATGLLRPVAQRWLADGRDPGVEATAPAVAEPAAARSTGRRSAAAAKAGSGATTAGTKASGTKKTSGTKTSGTKTSGTKSSGAKSAGSKASGTGSTANAAKSSAGRSSSGQGRPGGSRSGG